MKFPTLEEIQTMPLSELHKAVFGSFKRKEFAIIYTDIPKSILANEEVTIDDIKTLFNFNVKERTYQFPYADERKTFVEEFLGYRILPLKGFFWLVEPSVRERMFGLIDVEFSISKVTVKANEERFENLHKVYREMKHFYYDFENEQYIQINKQGENEETNEYKHREQLYSAVLQRLEEENSLYLKRLTDYANYFMSNDPINVVSFLGFFNYFLRFLEEEVPFLEFKLLIGHMDGENYYHMKEFFKDRKKEVEDWIEELEKAKGKGLLSDFNTFHMFEHAKWFENMNKTINKIRLLFKERDLEEIRKNNKNTIDGFYSYDDHRLYANLIYIEIERAFKKVGGGVENRRKEELKLLTALLTDGTSSDAKKEVKKLFTPEQEEQMKQLIGAERVTYITDILKELVLKKVISESDKSMYLEMYR